MVYKIKIILEKSSKRYNLASINVGKDGSVYTSLSKRWSKKAHFSDHASGQRHLNIDGKPVHPVMRRQMNSDEYDQVVSASLSTSGIEEVGFDRADTEIVLKEEDIDRHSNSSISVFKIGEEKWKNILNEEQPFGNFVLWKVVRIAVTTPKLIIGFGTLGQVKDSGK